MTATGSFRCICDPDDLFEPPDPRPRVVEGCPAHQVRGVVQQFKVRLGSSEARICGDEQEPDGELCIGWFNFAPGDVQAKCTVCGGWEGRWAPMRQRSVTCCDSHNRHCEPPGDLCCAGCPEVAHDTFPTRHADGSRCVMEDQ